MSKGGGRGGSRTENPRAVFITETNRIHLVLFGAQNRTLDPYLAAIHGILIPVLIASPSEQSVRTVREQRAARRTGQWTPIRQPFMESSFQ
jgi:hypothetical protein